MQTLGLYIPALVNMVSADNLGMNGDSSIIVVMASALPKVFCRPIWSYT